MEQHLQALQRANEVRLSRAVDKRSILKGKLTIKEVLESEADYWDTAKIGSLFEAQSRWGRERTRKFLTKYGVFPDRQIGTLTEYEKDRICQNLIH